MILKQNHGKEIATLSEILKQKNNVAKKELFEVMSIINVENKITVTNETQNNGINTTPEELRAHGFIMGLLCRQIDPARITMRDARSYCAILIDDNNRKTLCRLFLESSKKKIELPKINKTIEIKDIYEIKKAKSALFEVLNILENKGLETVKEPLQLPEPQNITRELELQAQHNQAEAVADFVESEPLQVIEPPTLPEPEQQQPEPYTVRAGQPPMSYLDEVTPRPEAKATVTETKNPSWME